MKKWLYLDDEQFLQTQRQEGLIHSFHGKYYKYESLQELDEELSNHAFPIVSETTNISTVDYDVPYGEICINLRLPIR